MKLLTVFFILISSGAFAQQKEFSWLVGTWQEEGKQAFEVWKNEKGFLSAESYKMNGEKKIMLNYAKLMIVK